VPSPFFLPALSCVESVVLRRRLVVASESGLLLFLRGICRRICAFETCRWVLSRIELSVFPIHSDGKVRERSPFRAAARHDEGIARRLFQSMRGALFSRPPVANRRRCAPSPVHPDVDVSRFSPLSESGRRRLPFFSRCLPTQMPSPLRAQYDMLPPSLATLDAAPRAISPERGGRRVRAFLWSRFVNVVPDLSWSAQFAATVLRFFPSLFFFTRGASLTEGHCFLSAGAAPSSVRPNFLLFLTIFRTSRGECSFSMARRRRVLRAFLFVGRSRRRYRAATGLPFPRRFVPNLRRAAA